MTRVAFFLPSGERRITALQRLMTEFQGLRRLAESGGLAQSERSSATHLTLRAGTNMRVTDAISMGFADRIPEMTGSQGRNLASYTSCN